MPPLSATLLWIVKVRERNPKKKRKKKQLSAGSQKSRKNFFGTLFAYILFRTLWCVFMKKLMFFPTKQLWRFSKLPFSELVVPQEFTSELAPLKLDFQTCFSNSCMRIYILLTSLCSLVTSSILIFCLINFMEIMVSTHKTKYVCCQFIYILSSLPVKLSCSK